jgi:hypothetical protein
LTDKPKPPKAKTAKRATVRAPARSLITRGEARLELTDEEIDQENAKLVEGLIAHKTALDYHMGKLLHAAVLSGAPLVTGTFPLPTHREGAHRTVTIVLGYGDDTAAAIHAAIEDIADDDDEEQSPSV